MKIERRLIISSAEVPVIAEQVMLGLSEAGRAQFTVAADSSSIKVGAAVAFDVSYARDGDWQRLFLGYVERVTPIDGRQSVLFCRELCAILSRVVSLNLRHPDLPAVLQAMSDKTQLSFAAGAGVYAKTKVANFANVGTGYQALTGVGRVFAVDDFIWQQQGDGVIYVGSWADSRWADRAVSADGSVFVDQFASGGGRMAAVPSMRPGVLLNDRRVVALEFSGNFMSLRFAA